MYVLEIDYLKINNLCGVGVIHVLLRLRLNLFSTGSQVPIVVEEPYYLNNFCRETAV